MPLRAILDFSSKMTAFAARGGAVTLGIAMLGVTHPHASARAEAFSRLPEIRIIGVCEEDPVADAFCSYLKVPRLSLDKLLADPDVDICLIHSTTSEATAYTVAALRARKAVLSEKPCAPNPAAMQRIVDCVAETGGFFQAGYNFRYSPVVDFLHRIVREDLLGQLTQVRVRGGCALQEHLTPLLNQPEDIGGAFFVIGCHVVDILLSLLGPPKEVGATIAKFPNLSDAKSREDAVTAALLYDHMLASVDFASQDPLGHVESYEFFLNGLKGVACAKLLPAEYKVFLAEGGGAFSKGWSSWQETTYPIEWSGVTTDYSPIIPIVSNLSFFEREAKAFLSALREKRAATIDANHALIVMKTLDACYRSGAQGGTRLVL
jgi:predicted dehydrogenase